MPEYPKIWMQIRNLYHHNNKTKQQINKNTRSKNVLYTTKTVKQNKTQPYQINNFEITIDDPAIKQTTVNQ